MYEEREKLLKEHTLSILRFSSQPWTMTAADSAKLDACDQSCLRKICGVHWGQHVTNDEIRRRTGQLPVSKLIAKRRLELFEHIGVLIRLLIPDVPSQPQRRWTGAGRVEGRATRGDRPLRLM